VSRIVTGYIEPVSFKKLRNFVATNTEQKLKEHDPGLAPPDYDHPLIKTLIQQMPSRSYSELEAVKSHLEKHDQRSMTNPRVVDGMLRLVNAELQKRDKEREQADISFLDFLKGKGVVR
jgi:hypothetical protein